LANRISQYGLPNKGEPALRGRSGAVRIWTH
jgi:hypothetical protein